ncbi:hypothetical protein P4O66_017481, partial [Electrophorus voltai]
LCLLSPILSPGAVAFHLQPTGPTFFFFIQWESQEVSEASQPVPPHPMILPVTFQPFVVLRARRPPAGQLWHPVHRAGDPSRPGEARAACPVLSAGLRLCPDAVGVLGCASCSMRRDGSGVEEVGVAKLSCFAIYAFWQTQEVRASCVTSSKCETCLAEVEPPPRACPASRGGVSHRNQLELYYHAQPNSSGTCRRGRQGSGYNISSVRINGYNISSVRISGYNISSVRISGYNISSVSVEAVITSALALVKRGVSFHMATPSNSSLWDVTLDTGSDGSVGIICEKRFNVSGERCVTCDTEQVNTAVLMPVRTVAMETDGSVKDVSGVHQLQLHRRGTEDQQVASCSSLVLRSQETAQAPGQLPAKERVESFVGYKGGICKTRCDYVYVNGIETKGRVHMLVNFTYSNLSAQLEMKVWIPRLPLDIELNQIRNWRVPITSNKREQLQASCVGLPVLQVPRMPLAYNRNRTPSRSSAEGVTRGCTLNIWLALVRVLAHFVAEGAGPRDPQAYFLGSDWQVDVSRLVGHFLKVEDPQHRPRVGTELIINSTHGGLTSIKVLSPLSDSILAEKSVRVLEERVSVTELGLQLVSGLTLTLQLSTGSNRAVSATATTQEVLDTPRQGCCHHTYITTHSPRYQNHLCKNITWRWARAEMTIRGACRKTRRKGTLAAGSVSLTVKLHAGGDYGNDSEDTDRVGIQQEKLLIIRSEGEDAAWREISTSTQLGRNQAASRFQGQTRRQHDRVRLGADAGRIKEMPAVLLQEVTVGPSSEPCGTPSPRSSCHVGLVTSEPSTGSLGAVFAYQQAEE